MRGGTSKKFIKRQTVEVISKRCYTSNTHPKAERKKDNIMQWTDFNMANLTNHGQVPFRKQSTSLQCWQLYRHIKPSSCLFLYHHGGPNFLLFFLKRYLFTSCLQLGIFYEGFMFSKCRDNQFCFLFLFGADAN